MKTFILSALAFLLNFTANSQLDWQTLNPKPSASTGFQMHFVNSTTGYISSPQNILKTTDGGLTWNIIESIDPGMHAMAFYSSLGIIAGKDGTIIKTNDTGGTWSTIQLGSSYDLNSISIIDYNNWILSSNNKIFKTSSAGLTWTQINFSGPNIIKTFFTSLTTGHAICSNKSIMKTVNGGLSWYVTVPQHSFDGFTEIHFINENVGFASRGGAILKTTDGGETWSIVHSSQYPLYSFNFINSDTGFASGYMNMMFRTDDGGNTWEQIGVNNTMIYASILYDIHFIDSNNGFATGSGGKIIKTIDGGQNWTNYSPLYETITQLQFTSENIAYAFAKNDIFKSLDGGYNWTLASTLNSTQPTLNHFDFIDDNVGYAIAGQYVYKTTDGANTWNLITTLPYTLVDKFYSIDFVNENTGFVSGNYSSGKTFKTIDGGITWQNVEPVCFGQMQFLNENIGFAIHPDQGKIYKSTDGGLSWSQSFETNDSQNISSFHFVNENTGFIVGNGFAYKTSNSGLSWQELTVSYNDYLLVKFKDPDMGYMANNGGAIYRTNNGGQTWHYPDQDGGILDIAFYNNNTYLAGAYGKIIKSGAGTLGNYETNYLSKNIVTVYPNPTATQSSLVANDIISDITIYDMAGRNIKHYNNINATNKLLNLEHIGPGIYTALVKFSNGTTASVKLIKK